MRKTFGTFPELFFMGVGLFWIAESYFTVGSINYFAILVTWLLFVQFFYKNRLAGLIYGIAFGSFSVYMLLSLIADNGEAVSPLYVTNINAVDSVLFAVGIIMSVAMVYKYVTTKVDYDESVLTVTY
ncbi:MULTISPECIES: hypothetical protein [Flavobacterium]|uniref:Transmembrane family 220, helix n=1 Tax=Flavobacterium suzhouense TaxID=1529638 RepID=A0ABW5NW26_9FLAO|nr:hypothetical protein [Flavobacterium sp. AG291]RDI09733.1 hypothetical protein DEU42_10929 [Flavobacterium sp. AG291]